MNRESLVEELDEIIYVSDPVTYDLYYMNRPGAEIMGYTGDSYLGKKCYEVLQGADSPCPFCTNHLLRYDQNYLWEFSNPHLGRHYILKDKLIDWNGKPARMEFAIDITAKENVSRQLSDKLEIEKVIVDCIRSLFSTDNLTQAIGLVLKSIGTFYDADRVYIFEIDYSENVCNNTYEWCNDGIQPQIDFLQHVDIHLIDRWIDSFHRREPVIIEDLEALRDVYPSEYEALHVQNIRSLRALPFTIHNRLSGYIGLDNPAAHKDDLSLLDSLSYFIMNEVSKRRMQARLHSMSYHDALTGLPNRNSYIEYLAQERQLRSLGVAVADINGLKHINENHGHEAGDRTIRQTSSILCRHFDERTIFRLSGDEIVILAENLSREEFIEKIRALKEELNRDWDGVTLGYTWSDMDINVKQLVNHADELMYIEKQSYYKRSASSSKHHDPVAISRLRHAIDAGCFEMYLQPKADIRTGKISGAEALVRLHHPQHGLLQPIDFVPTLEKEKLIQYIDLFIYEEVCRTLSRWREQGASLFPISLNFSRITMLESNLLPTLEEIYSRYDVPRELIEIEITETIGEMERETIAEIGSNIRKLGFGISLDDFGAKYTSMSMLTIMKFDMLKLDRSLVYNLAQNADSRTVVKYIIEMCREMGAKSIAEGVETEEQLALLRGLDCDMAQGYLFSKPVPCSEFEKKYLSELRP